MNSSTVQHTTVPCITDAELDLLPIKQRDVLVARVFNHNPYEAIAEHYGIPVGTVKSRLNRARAKIGWARSAAATGGAS